MRAILVNFEARKGAMNSEEAANKPIENMERKKILGERFVRERLVIKNREENL